MKILAVCALLAFFGAGPVQDERPAPAEPMRQTSSIMNGQPRPEPQAEAEVDTAIMEATPVVRPIGYCLISANRYCRYKPRGRSGASCSCSGEPGRFQ